MTERTERRPHAPAEDSHWLTSEQYHYLDNRLFVASLLRSAPAGDEHLEHAVLNACAETLDLADQRFGRNTSKLGIDTRPNVPKDGVWGPHGVPLFYHNGDGTRLAMLGAASYMDFTNEEKQKHGKPSPYQDQRTYLTTLLTAAYDDIVFGEYGRGGDERASAEHALQDLTRRGFSKDIIQDVVVSIVASTFDEATARQNIDHAKGAAPIQDASAIGDLWALGTAQGPLNTLLLGIENLWKQDTAATHGQILRNTALAAWDRYGWHGESLADFIQLIDSDYRCRQAFGSFLLGNPTFILKLHKYPDPAVNTLMFHGKQQSATLQTLLGRDIQFNRMSVGQAFHCALSYAHAKKWAAAGYGPGAAFPGYAQAENIGAALLTRRTGEEIAHPVDAGHFYAQYIQDIAARQPRTRIPKPR